MMNAQAQGKTLKALLFVWSIRLIFWPVVMAAIAAVASAVHMSGEAQASDYHLLVQEWGHASTSMRMAIAAGLEDGKLSRWEASKLTRQLIDEVRVLSFERGSWDAAVERQKLVKLANTISVPGPISR